MAATKTNSHKIKALETVVTKMQERMGSMEDEVQGLNQKMDRVLKLQKEPAHNAASAIEQLLRLQEAV